MLAAFITYTSMYAFRKPLSAGIFAILTLWGVDYKILALTIQFVGYMLSKFLGIGVIFGMNNAKRILYILMFIAISWVRLFLFSILPLA